MMDVSRQICVVLLLSITHSHAQVKYNKRWAGLTIFPNDTRNDTEILDLGRNRLWEIPKRALAGKTLLYEIKLDYNTFKSFPDLCEVGPTLEHLFLNDNFMTEINESDISCLEKLTLLSINNNPFSEFQDLSPIGSRLETLLASYFYEIQIPVDILSKLTNLTHLRLSNNKLTQDRLRDLGINSSKIQLLDLGDNHLNDIPGDVFGQFGALSTLELQVNKFRGIPRVNNISANLSVLDLTDTDIDDPPADYFEGMPMLKKIKIRSCQLTTWPISFNDVASTLTDIDISFNQITTIPNLIRFPKLSSLTAHHNPIVSISSLADSIGPNIYSLSFGVAGPLHDRVFAGSFPKLRSMRFELYQGNNARFPKLGSMPLLSGLYVGDSNIDSVPVDAFKGTPRLVNLVLENNRLRTLYNFSQHTPRLRELFLNGNDLVCDCNLQWLQEFATRKAIRLSRGSGSRICSHPQALATKNLIGEIPENEVCKGIEAWYKKDHMDYVKQPNLTMADPRTVYGLDDCAINCFLDHRCEAFEMNQKEKNCTLKFKDMDFGVSDTNVQAWKLYTLHGMS